MINEVSELQSLLSPLSPQEFVSSYFGRKSLFVEGGPDKVGGLFSREKLNHALERGAKIQDKRYNIMASFTRGEAQGSSKQMVEANRHQVDSLFDSGATICVTNIHMADPDLARWAQKIRAQLNFTGVVGVNCYLSPDGAGLSTHYDARVVTNLQISGHKRWRYSTEGAKPWPDHNAVYQDGQGKTDGADPGRLPPDMEFREVDMKPGDLLCLPAGAWHSAKAGGESLAINVYFQPRNFLEQLTPLLQGFAASSGEWRAGAPVSLDVHGEMPPTVSLYLRERLDEFHKLALELLENPDRSIEPWLGAATHFPYTGWQPTPKASLQGLTDTQRFRVAKSALRFVQVQNKLVLPVDNSVLRFPIAAGPMLSRLASESGTFTRQDVLAWAVKPDGPDAKKILSYLQILIENRIVEPATSPERG